MSSRRGSTAQQKAYANTESPADTESVQSKKDRRKDKDKVNKGHESPDRSEKGGKQAKQVKIDDMMVRAERDESNESGGNDTETKLRALIEVVTRLDEKINELASKDYIAKALDKRLEGIVSESFVNTSLEKLKKDISDQMKSDLDQVYEKLRSVKGKLKEAESDIEQLKNSDSDRQTEVQKVVEENDKLKKRNKELNERVYENQDRIKYAEYQVNELEQYTRKNSIRIYGINDTNKNESSVETGKEIIKLIKEKLDITIDAKDIDIAHRLGKFNEEGNRPAICKFVYRTIKQEVMSRRKQLKGSSYVIREDLTIKNAKLLEKLSVKDEVKNCWSDDGKIIALLTNDRKIRVDSFTDLTRSLLRS